jgi:hypothetical protein
MLGLSREVGYPTDCIGLEPRNVFPTVENLPSQKVALIQQISLKYT